MEKMFDIVTENAVLGAKSTILEEAAGTPAGGRYVYIVESAGEVIKKAKDFVVRNKGKLALLAGAGALAGAGYYAHKEGKFADAAQSVSDAAGGYARDQRGNAGTETWRDKFHNAIG